MPDPRRRAALVLALAASAACRPANPSMSVPSARSAPPDPVFAGDLPERLRQLPRTAIDYDRAAISGSETRVLQKLIEAARFLDEIYLRQVSPDNAALRDRLERAARAGEPGAASALAYFHLNAGPWDRLKQNEAFVGSRPKPPGAGFYPADLGKGEFDGWLAAHPADRNAFQGLFTVIRRRGSDLVAVPYSREYPGFLAPAAEKLREAAGLTGDASLRDFLVKRADALLSDDYYASDLAWMDVDSDIEVVFGPYEVYEDGLFNYKAAFEAFVTVRDRGESEKLAVYAAHLKDMESNLPIPDEHKNTSRGFESPIRVVQEVFTAGDARRGVQTSAFNLPNDERVRQAKGSKKVLLKNVMEAKFRQSGRPVALRVMAPAALPHVSFGAYFNHTLFHELSHGLGPGIIRTREGARVESRLLLKNRYSTIEECKADVLGIWNLLYAIDQKLVTSFDASALFATNAGLMFRSMRFGIDEAHGQGTAVQWNWFRETGGIVPAADGRFQVDDRKFREATRSLANELLMIEATGDFDRAGKLLDKYGRTTPEIGAVIGRLADIPVDIAPVFPAAGESVAGVLDRSNEPQGGDR